MLKFNITPREAREQITRLKTAQVENLTRRGRLPDGHSAEIELLQPIAARAADVVLRLANESGVVRKFIPIDRDGLALAFLVKDAAEGGRNFDAVISTAREDRDGDRIPLKGWQLGKFQQNPVVLAGHDHSAFPVAKAESVRVTDNALRMVGVFPPPGSSQRSDEARALVNAGILRAVSVGFRALARPTPNALGGFDYSTQELLEVSLVSLPANPDALITRVW